MTTVMGYIFDIVLFNFEVKLAELAGALMVVFCSVGIVYLTFKEHEDSAQKLKSLK